MPGIRIKCKKCGDIIQSMHRHDFVSCKCGQIFIDGGGEYTRIGWKGEGELEDNVEELTKEDVK